MILIVDDKPENLFSLQKTLASEGLDSDTANSGEDALKKVLKTDFELIILDVQMPGMDGFEVAEALSGFNKTKDIPILFLSAASKDKKFITKGFSSGGVDYITKPADPDILLLKVKNFIRLHRQTKELQDIQRTLQAEVESRRQAQDELRRQAHELHSVLEALPQLAYTARVDGTLEYTNRAWHDFSNGPLDFPEVPAGDKPLKLIWQEAVVAARPIEQDVCLLYPGNRQKIHFLWRTMPVLEGERIAKWVGTFTNIQQQKVASEVLEQKVVERTRELQNTNAELEESNHELQQFASVASHDLKEPLRKIQIFSNLVHDKYRAGNDPDFSGYMDRIIRSSGRMTNLINDLLQFSKLSAGERFQETSIEELIPEILADLEIQIKEKGAIIEVGTLPVIEAVPGQMRQVFQNLISNAIKFSRQKVPPRIRIEGTASNGVCRITVADNGIGFDDVYRDKIFNLFQRLHGRDEYEGTGIGLAIAKKIMLRHNGTISAESRPNEGTRFILQLPVKQDMHSKRQPAE